MSFYFFFSIFDNIYEKIMHGQKEIHFFLVGII